MKKPDPSKNYDYTALQRSRRSKEKWNALGFTARIDRKVHPDDKADIVKYIEKKNRERLKMLDTAPGTV